MKQEALFSHQKMPEGIIRISALLGEHIYLVLGKERAALIDTGMGIGSLKAYALGLTTLPFVVINTHGHPDHAGGNAEFDRCYMHPADIPWYQKMCTREYRSRDVELLRPKDASRLGTQLLPMGKQTLPLEDMAQIELGGRTLQVIHTPGHTPGSVCLWDDQSKALFAGDSLSSQMVWMYDEYSEPLDVYYQSMRKLQGILEALSGCYIGHSPGYISGEAVEGTLVCARRILMCDAQGTPTETFAGKGLLYRYGTFSILYNPQRLFSHARNEE